MEVSKQLGCFGCLLELVGFIGVIWVLTHVSEIFAFLDGLVGA